MKMPEILLNKLLGLLTCFFILSIHSNAQLGIGTRLGFHIADQKIEDTIDDSLSYQSISHVSFGGIVAFEISEYFSIQPEFHFLQKGGKTIGEATSNLATIKLETIKRFQYLEIPLLAKLSLGSESIKALILAGPSIGFPLTGEKEETTTINGQTMNEKRSLKLDQEEIKGYELGAQAGIGVGLYFGTLSIFADYRYLFGITDISKDDEVTIKNTGSNIGAGILISF